MVELRPRRRRAPGGPILAAAGYSIRCPLFSGRLYVLTFKYLLGGTTQISEYYWSLKYFYKVLDIARNVVIVLPRGLHFTTMEP